MWEESVGRVRAGRQLLPGGWPAGAVVAVGVSFDVDHETPWLRDGDLGPSGLSYGEFGSRRGLPRILDLLDTHSIPATFFIPAVAAQLHPNDVTDIRAAGHEIGCHGWIHERPELLEPATEAALLNRSLDALEHLTGTRPTGQRTPSFGCSEVTMRIARDAGLVYDSSLMADDHPYEIVLDGKPSGLIELPVDWSRDDAAFLVTDRYGGLRPIPDPRQLTDAWYQDYLVARDEGGMFQLTLHPDLIGRRGPSRALADLIARISSDSDVWFATHAQIAAALPLEGRST
jgi:peptidoglycan/xylan/chitin deacetylase (PgdA/CDA1 family)